MPERPNVLCFVTDQLRYDHLGCTGNDVVRTPNIDALAADGVTCERAYVQKPVCMPARGSLLTGRMPREIGMRFHGAPLDTDVVTLPAALGGAGYRTYSAGKLHLNHYGTPSQADPADLDPDRHPECMSLWNGGYIDEFPEPYYGFDTVDFTAGHTVYIHGEYVRWLEAEHPAVFEDLRKNDLSGPTDVFHLEDVPPEEAHYNRWIADRTRAFIEGVDDPFFAWCSFPDPHPPWTVPDPYAEMYDPDDVGAPTRREGEIGDLPPHYAHPEVTDREGSDRVAYRHGGTDSDGDIRDNVATSYGMTSFVDREVGRVMETLESEGLREDTLVVFLSDHGNMFGDHWQSTKGLPYDGSARVPLIWSWPGRLPGGRRVESPVSLLDLVPTVLDLCTVPYPEPGYDGYVDPGDEMPALPGESLHGLLCGDADPTRGGVVIETGDGEGGDDLRARTYVTDRYKLTVYPGQSYGELFDLREDPDELYNRWDDPDYADVRARLHAEFLDAYIGSESGLPRSPSPGA